MKAIAPSILSADFANLRGELKALEEAGIKVVHLDSMDGMFVPNITFGPPVVKAIRADSKLVFDVHLMIEEPSRYVEEYIKAGADILTVHYEACKDPLATVRQIKSLGAKAGISVKPNTQIEEILPLLCEVDLVLVMSVEPGFGGQKFMSSAIDKIKMLKKLRENKGFDYIISIDGGINEQNIHSIVEDGAELIVVGSAFFKSSDYKAQAEIFGAALI